ncbi:hypothetical protein ACH4F6_34615 [Streptomyces sp. NPDC017936]|uniref:hypothetical protein n=1 Tax=Streptomyces sp. NPDC017936 TaxID=3365016 RepID=UPI00379D6E38
MRQLSADELAAALPRDGTLPGYELVGPPRTSDGDKPQSVVGPAACRPLQDAFSAPASATAAAWVNLTPDTFVPPTESLTFSSYRPGGASASLAALDKALTTCATYTLQGSYGGPVTVDVERVELPDAPGDDALSFRTHWVLELDGSKSDTFRLTTAVRVGEATLTLASDIGAGSELPEAKKRALMPQLNLDLLKSQTDALRAAQRR